MTDWTLPIDQLPDEVAFSDLPPVAQALVRRNVLLREKLAAAEAALQAAEERIRALEAQKTST
ncbi:MAG: hypothetical protein JNG86_06075 [Verrucomicrobiaceae bacterium]|nr:hypothetical protein [Verrucomicrobiaceae bacterium]